MIEEVKKAKKNYEEARVDYVTTVKEAERQYQETIDDAKEKFKEVEKEFYDKQQELQELLRPVGSVDSQIIIEEPWRNPFKYRPWWTDELMKVPTITSNNTYPDKTFLFFG